MKQLLSLVVTQDTTQQQTKTNIVRGKLTGTPPGFYVILHPFGTQDLEVNQICLHLSPALLLSRGWWVGLDI